MVVGKSGQQSQGQESSELMHACAPLPSSFFSHYSFNQAVSMLPPEPSGPEWQLLPRRANMLSRHKLV